MSERPERYISHRLALLTDQLAAIPFPSSTEQEQFADIIHLVAALLSTESQQRSTAIGDAWEAAATDADAAQAVATELRHLVERANFVEVTPAELDEIMVTESLVRLRLHVDLEEYDELQIYRRGGRTETVEVKSWRGLRTETLTVTVDDAVLLYARVRPRTWFEEHGVDLDELKVEPGHRALKLFRNVPRADIEMLLPSTHVRFRLKDRLKLGVPAVASGILVLTTKLLPTLGLIALVVATWVGLRKESPRIDQDSLIVLVGSIIGIGLYFYRQWKRLQHRRIKYLKILTENLYFRAVADGPGVLYTLARSAADQDVAEVLLAYRFLLESPDGQTAEQLDEVVERWLDHAIDFEVDDALGALDRLGLCTRDDARLRAVDLDTAHGILERRWAGAWRPGPSLGS